MITSTLESSRCVVTSTRFTQLRHDVTLINRLSFISHRVDVLSGFLSAERHMFVGSLVRTGLAGCSPGFTDGAAAQVLSLRYTGCTSAATSVWLPVHVTLSLTDVHTFLSIGHGHIALRAQAHIGSLHVPADTRSTNIRPGALVNVLTALLVMCELPAVSTRADERSEGVGTCAVLT